MSFVAILCFNAQPNWLQLSRLERGEIVAKEFGPLLARHPSVRHRHIDAEGFHGKISDVELFEFDDIQEYYALIEELRDTSLIARGYFSLIDTIFGIEDGFRVFEAKSQQS